MNKTYFCRGMAVFVFINSVLLTIVAVYCFGIEKDTVKAILNLVAANLFFCQGIYFSYQADHLR